MVAKMVAPTALGDTAIVSSPLTNTTKKVLGRDPSTENSNDMPGAAGLPWTAVKAGKGLSGKGAFVAGHDLIKAAASVKTAFNPSAVPYGLAAATSPRTARCRLVWMASVTRMEAATPRFAGSVMTPAPPRYAEVPTPSRTDDNVMKLLTSV